MKTKEKKIEFTEEENVLIVGGKNVYIERSGSINTYEHKDKKSITEVGDLYLWLSEAVLDNNQ